MVNMRTAASVTPKVVPIVGYVPTTLASMYQPAVGVGSEIVSLSLVNQDPTTAQSVSLFIVPASGTAPSGVVGPACLVPNVSIPAKGSIELGQRMIGEQDAIWAVATNASKVALIITVNEFSNATGAVLSGVQPGFTGSGGHGTAGSASGTNKTGSAPNRRLVAGLIVAESGGSGAGWASYTGGQPAVSCTDGAMTRKVSIDINNGAGIVGSAHIYTYDNPTPGLTQAISATAAATGATMTLLLGSKEYYGVDLTAGLGAVTTGPTGAAVMSMPYTLGANDVPVFVGGFVAFPQALNMNPVEVDNIPSGFTIPQYLFMADLFAAGGALTAADGNSTVHGAVGMVLHPA